MRLEDIGELHVTFEYDNRSRSQPVMSKVFANVRYVGSYHYMTVGGAPRITVVTEDTPEQRAQLAKARRILMENGGQEREVDAELLEGFRERRRRKARLAARGEVPLRTQGHHEHGAIMHPDGTIIPRNQG